MKALFWGQDRSGCTWYRTILPGRALEKYDPHSYAVLDSAWSEERYSRAVDLAEVHVLGRRIDRRWAEVMELAARSGIKLIFDLDDNLFDVSPTNYLAYKIFGTAEVELKATADGSKRWLWRDGRSGFDLARNRATIDSAVRILRAAAGITVTTPELARVYQDYNPRIAILPNCVNLDHWPLLSIDHGEEIRIGWSGGSSHLEDWNLIKPVLKELWSDPDFAARCKLVVCGAHFPSMTEVVPRERLEVRAWVDVEAHSYHQATLGLDLALIPLEDTRFNRCKSPIKWIEYSALGVPAICSNIPPYRPVVERGKTGFLATDKADWIECIRRLVEDPGRRLKVGGAARRAVEERFDQKLYAEAWDKAVRWMAA